MENTEHFHGLPADEFIDKLEENNLNFFSTGSYYDSETLFRALIMTHILFTDGSCSQMQTFVPQQIDLHDAVDGLDRFVESMSLTAGVQHCVATLTPMNEVEPFKRTPVREISRRRKRSG